MGEIARWGVSRYSSHQISELTNQVCFGLPLLLAACEFQSNACFSMDSSPFLSVWRIHRHFLIQICNIIGFSPVASYRSELLIIVGHHTPIIIRKLRLTNVCNLFVIWLVTFRVSHPYSYAVVVRWYWSWKYISMGSDRYYDIRTNLRDNLSTFI
jgi:hypothetical protein